ncbi:glycerol uptake protein, putative [Leishmania donovani]|uniref:Glycerol uptake protein, putative n=1 Tax=Leishmania donovani TaxID=5661 RepID=E9BEC3_LEIDO|nr:glycerol uptake protein, putative [Leishmania donovani]CBZ33599.1 glycerol uptake protein, putative [Leishmania donovani]
MRRAGKKQHRLIFDPSRSRAILIPAERDATG